MKDNPLIAMLQQVPLFAGLDEPALRALAGRCRRRKFGPREALFHKDDPGLTLYILISGSVALQTVTLQGETVHLAQRGPGEAFGELALIDGKGRMADAVTSEPCEILILDRDEFRLAIREYPDIAFSVMAYLGDRLRQAAAQTQSRQELDVLGRVSQVLLDLSRSAGTPEPGGGTRLTMRLTQQDLADRIGSTRESVSRALSSLKSLNAIRAEGRAIVILSVKKLSRYANVEM